MTSDKKLLEKLANAHGRYLKSDIRHNPANSNLYVRALTALDNLEKLVNEDLPAPNTLIMQANTALFDLEKMLNPYTHNMKSLEDYLATGKDVDYEIESDKSPEEKCRILEQFYTTYKTGDYQLEIKYEGEKYTVYELDSETKEKEFKLRIFHSVNLSEARAEKEKLSSVKSL